MIWCPMTITTVPDSNMSAKAAALTTKAGDAVKVSPTTEHNRQLLQEAMRTGVGGDKIWKEEGMGSNLNVYL